MMYKKVIFSSVSLHSFVNEFIAPDNGMDRVELSHSFKTHLEKQREAAEQQQEEELRARVEKMYFFTRGATVTS